MLHKAVVSHFLAVVVGWWDEKNTLKHCNDKVTYFDSEIVTAVALYHQDGTVCICVFVDIDIKLVTASTQVLQLLMAPATTASMHTVMRSWMSGENDTSGDRVGRQQRGSSISTHTWRHCTRNTTVMTLTPLWVLALSWLLMLLLYLSLLCVLARYRLHCEYLLSVGCWCCCYIYLFSVSYLDTDCHATLGCVCMIMWDLGRKEQQLRISIRVVRLRLVKTVRILE